MAATFIAPKWAETAEHRQAPVKVFLQRNVKINEDGSRKAPALRRNNGNVDHVIRPWLTPF
jgi:hypothetical protein